MKSSGECETAQNAPARVRGAGVEVSRGDVHDEPDGAEADDQHAAAMIVIAEAKV
jgi:hypothetical protein